MNVLESLYTLAIFSGIAIVVRRSKESVGRSAAWDARLRRLVLALPAVALVVLAHALIVAVS